MRTSVAGAAGVLAGLGAGLGIGGCGDEVPHGGLARTPEAPLDRRVEPTDLLPADLDLVVRVDLGRLRAGLGATAVDALAARMPGEPLLRRALARADSVTVGLRADDLESGDRVVVVEGPFGEEAPPEAPRFTPAPPILEGVRGWDAGEDVTSRAAVARILRVGDRATLFVTPLFVDATSRVLREGSDAARGQPFAEGLISLDWRPRPLRSSLAKRYPSIAGVLRGVSRLRATASVGDAGVEVDAQIEATDEAAATKVARFFELLRENAGERDSARLRDLRIEPAGSSVHVTWVVPSAIVLAAVSGGEVEEEAAERSPESPPPSLPVP